jgi:hypothetical protein
MSSSKFIGGGFPAIKECNNKIQINKENLKKREFSIKKILPLNQILIKKKLNNSNYTNSDSTNYIDSIKYDTHKFQNTQNIDISLINKPFKPYERMKRKISKKKSKRKISKQSKKKSKQSKKKSKQSKKKSKQSKKIIK